MANNYVQFSWAIYDLTAEESVWLREEIAQAETYVQAKAEERPLPERPEWLENDDWLGFDYTFDGTTLYLYAEECGDVDQVAMLAQEFLKIFRRKQAFGIAFACTCSKPRVDEQYGGAIVVTDEKYVGINTLDWMEETRVELEKELNSDG